MDQDVLPKPSRIIKLRNWYGRWERPISSLSLVGGFVFDALTLKRVDLFWENLWVVVHIVIVGVCIVLIQGVERQEGDEANPSKLHFWLANIQQFFYGGIWSTFLVFYFRASDIAVSWPFLLALALAFWANERLKRHFVRLVFQVSLFFLAVFCFAIYLVPVLVRRIGPDVFLLSGAVSLAFIVLYLALIRLVSGRTFGKKNKYVLTAAIGGIFFAVNALYFTSLIPPLPLSLRDAGVYYSVARTAAGYSLAGDQDFGAWYHLYPDFHFLSGQPVYVFTSVFSPAQFNLQIFHEWQHYDGSAKQWVTASKVPLAVNGGRDGGFRTYSEKTSLTAGRWRVNVVTAGGQVIGRIRFNLVPAAALPSIDQKID